MGLLDEAIREHLELKRLRGADPGEVAREEREALEAGAEEATSELSLTGAAASADEQGIALEDRVAENGGQETAEIDMREILEEELDISTGSASARGRFSVRNDSEDPDLNFDGSSLDWEATGDAAGGLSVDARRGSGPDGEPDA